MIEGFRFIPERLSPPQQLALRDEVLEKLQQAPLYQPTMPRSGKPLSVRMSNFGPLGWMSDKSGYRYVEHHPETHQPWPELPAILMEIWQDLSGYDAPPQACLVNWYSEKSRLGLHIDADEDAKDAPVISISLGDRARFRLGGENRADPTTSMRLASGDVVVLAGRSRGAYHGIDRIYPGTSRLIEGGGRINLTMRRVAQPNYRPSAVKP